MAALHALASPVLLTSHSPTCPCPAAPGAYVYVSPVTNATYMLNTSLQDSRAAQRSCNALGGHLASFNSSAEQADVEQHYAALGVLFPKYHMAYWTGLQADPTTFPPTWSWADPTVGPPAAPNYVNWGTYEPGSVAEPKVLTGSENCGAANWSMTVNATGAWGWAALQCRTRLVSICRVIRGWRGWMAGCAPEVMLQLCLA
jgi:hypothetical protein